MKLLMRKNEFPENRLTIALGLRKSNAWRLHLVFMCSLYEELQTVKTEGESV